jgi:ribosomal 50S subunit-recycling heat shock protein
MRLDKFLKYSGIIKRREVAKRVCEEGLAELNGRTAKPSTRVSAGDRLRIQIGLQISEHEILAVPGHHVPKADRAEYTRLLGSERIDPLAGI